MIDFLTISTRNPKRGVTEIYPKFIIKSPSSDLMIRGGDFYAVWIEELGLWSTNEQDALQIIDRELDKFAEENRSRYDGYVKVLHMWDAETGMIDRWHKFCQKQMRDSFHMLDEKIIFANVQTKKKDYASKKLSYPIEEGDISAYDSLMSVLYSPEERKKIEWAIGSIINGDSKKIQKFMVLYGASGTGKSTVLNIIQQLFDGYYSVFDARSLGSTSNSFALEAFKSNPLVAIQHDGDLSHIEDNTRLNSLVSHELMTVNEKFKSTYSNSFKCFLFMGTNKPVKITDAKSGLIRRLIDVSPTGNLVPPKDYKMYVKQIDFELGAIAKHCKDVYESDPGAYDDYIPLTMLGASNDFYNFVIDSYHIFKKENGTTLAQAWAMYNTYCEEAKVSYPFSKRIFKEELKNYFKEYKERFNLDDGTRVRSYYEGFRTDKFDDPYGKEKKKEAPKTHYGWLNFNSTKSIFDKECADCPAQYANAEEKPTMKWEKVQTTLKDIDTSQVHYVMGPKSLVTVDFDIPGEDGSKSFEKNVEAASKWPPTYAELSKSGAGIHLEYYYTGDPSTVSRLYSEHIEIKVSVGNSSLRRKLTLCNDLPIATISSGLPTKGEKMINYDAVKSEKGLRNLIERNLNKEIHAGTKPSMDFIFKILEDAYESGLKYDVSDMRQRIFVFAANSTHQSDYCIKLINKMKFRSEEFSQTSAKDDKLIFFDIEVYPNLLLVNWKFAEDIDWEKVKTLNKKERIAYFLKVVTNHKKNVVRMINPTSQEIEELLDHKIIGFNCRRYDNHILYGRLIGKTNLELFDISQKIISGSKNAMFGQAYNLSYTDVYDFCKTKMSLKKWEIELGFHHQEMSLPWDKPVPEELWPKVAEYCDNDVLATELAFLCNREDFIARQILADVAGMTVNDTTNSLTTRIIFGTNRNPQDQFNYRDMGDISAIDEEVTAKMIGNLDVDPEYTKFDSNGRPIFPGYKFDHGVSSYRDVDEVGEGGNVYSEPGMYGETPVEDVASMHPSSVIAEELFGEVYTKRFKEIVLARIYIKHKDFDKAKKLLDGKLAKYLDDESISKDLAGALKIAINSVYGLTSAKFDNAFRDPRNKDNIVAKRGALFMINLRHEVQRRGFTVAHIKTDSIKIPNATKDILKFVEDYGKLYGYSFEIEEIYDRICLVNDAVYIARYSEDGKPGEWTATGAQFQVPYVFKTLFSKEPLIFDDKCVTNSVSTAIYLDMNEGYPDVTDEEKELSKLESKYKKGELSDTDWEKLAPPLREAIAKGHNYIFVGKVGQFCPIKPGCGGGVLLREKDGKYYAVSNSTGYRWLESETVRTLGKEDDIDESFFMSMVDDAVETISKYGDFEQFRSDEPFKKEWDFMNIPEDAPEELPFELLPSKDEHPMDSDEEEYHDG